MPPLRERREDIPDLVEFLLARHAAALGKRISGVTHEAMQLLMACRWKGNVRELDNALQRAVILGEGPLITPGRPAAGPGPRWRTIRRWWMNSSEAVQPLREAAHRADSAPDPGQEGGGPAPGHGPVVALPPHRRTGDSSILIDGLTPRRSPFRKRVIRQNRRRTSRNQSSGPRRSRGEPKRGGRASQRRRPRPAGRPRRLPQRPAQGGGQNPQRCPHQGGAGEGVAMHHTAQLPPKEASGVVQDRQGSRPSLPRRPNRRPLRRWLRTGRPPAGLGQAGRPGSNAARESLPRPGLPATNSSSPRAAQMPPHRESLLATPARCRIRRPLPPRR